LSYIPTTAIIAYAFPASHHYRYYTEICHGIRSHHRAGHCQGVGCRFVGNNTAATGADNDNVIVLNLKPPPPVISSAQPPSPAHQSSPGTLPYTGRRSGRCRPVPPPFPCLRLSWPPIPRRCR